MNPMLYYVNMCFNNNISVQHTTIQKYIGYGNTCFFFSPFIQALKIRVKEISYINGDTKIVPETKSKTIYKLNGVTERDLRRTVLWLRDGLQCVCDEMSDIHAAYLVMGQKTADGHLVITSLKRWQRGQREFKRIARSIRKLQC